MKLSAAVIVSAVVLAEAPLHGQPSIVVTRSEAQSSRQGPAESFLASLDMLFTIEAAGEDDLRRAEELTIRTNQLNTTGYTYDYDELNALRTSADHLLLIASLEDKFGA